MADRSEMRAIARMPPFHQWARQQGYNVSNGTFAELAQALMEYTEAAVRKMEERVEAVLRDAPITTSRPPHPSASGQQ